MKDLDVCNGRKVHPSLLLFGSLHEVKQMPSSISLMPATADPIQAEHKSFTMQSWWIFPYEAAGKLWAPNLKTSSPNSSRCLPTRQAWRIKTWPAYSQHVNTSNNPLRSTRKLQQVHCAYQICLYFKTETVFCRIQPNSTQRPIVF